MICSDKFLWNSSTISLALSAWNYFSKNSKVRRLSFACSAFLNQRFSYLQRFLLLPSSTTFKIGLSSKNSVCERSFTFLPSLIIFWMVSLIVAMDWFKVFLLKFSDLLLTLLWAEDLRMEDVSSGIFYLLFIRSVWATFLIGDIIWTKDFDGCFVYDESTKVTFFGVIPSALRSVLASLTSYSSRLSEDCYYRWRESLRARLLWNEESNPAFFLLLRKSKRLWPVLKSDALRLFLCRENINDM